ncbi:hypothetical protein F4604DRAFT_1908148 [Suillus subluteus]|nr:hypothetical protein F4604DRAFT_1908148 [Suillus subluteus]
MNFNFISHGSFLPFTNFISLHAIIACTPLLQGYCCSCKNSKVLLYGSLSNYIIGPCIPLVSAFSSSIMGPCIPLVSALFLKHYGTVHPTCQLTFPQDWGLAVQAICQWLLLFGTGDLRCCVETGGWQCRPFVNGSCYLVLGICGVVLRLRAGSAGHLSMAPAVWYWGLTRCIFIPHSFLCMTLADALVLMGKVIFVFSTQGFVEEGPLIKVLQLPITFTLLFSRL